jgi:hypothetical protein
MTFPFLQLKYPHNSLLVRSTGSSTVPWNRSGDPHVRVPLRASERATRAPPTLPSPAPSVCDPAAEGGRGMCLLGKLRRWGPPLAASRAAAGCPIGSSGPPPRAKAVYCYNHYFVWTATITTCFWEYIQVWLRVTSQLPKSCWYSCFLPLSRTINLDNISHQRFQQSPILVGNNRQQRRIPTCWDCWTTSWATRPTW